MSFRLYESAWVRVDGREEPLQAHKHPSDAGVFVVGDHLYDVDARPAAADMAAPALLSILSLDSIRSAGLSSGYNRDFGVTNKPGRH